MTTLGRLERVDLRKVWEDEAGSFTPWLAEEENINLLGKAIGMELEVQSTEKEVGPFRADILCKETTSDHWVLIENQLEKTNHTHLGQLMTYAAGLKAVTIVWIAAHFRDEHRAALDWLNDVTNDSVNFFGLEIELWKIKDSPVAPKFNIVSKPNEWDGTAKELTETQQTQLAYWLAFKDHLGQDGLLKCGNSRPQAWIPISIGRAGFRLTAVASTWDSESGSYATGELRAELISEDKNFSKDYFEKLALDKEAIERDVGEPLTWYNPPKTQARYSKAYLRKSANVLDSNDWSSQHAWLKEKLELLHKVFADRVKSLVPPENEGKESSE